MTKRKLIGALALVCVLGLVGAACGNDNPGTTRAVRPRRPRPARRLRQGPPQRPRRRRRRRQLTRAARTGTAIEDFGFTGAFDPTGEYLGTAWGLYSQLLLRTLMTYKHIAGADGERWSRTSPTEPGRLRGRARPTRSQLKDGVKFGPPLNRAVTSKDIAYAFERINTQSLVAQYGFYYDGSSRAWTERPSGRRQTISGIETPDDKTIIFHLTKPTGDFLYRLAMPATAPIPPEVAGLLHKAGDYGRYVISSGPYMIAGRGQARHLVVRHA